MKLKKLLAVLIALSMLASFVVTFTISMNADDPPPPPECLHENTYKENGLCTDVSKCWDCFVTLPGTEGQHDEGAKADEYCTTPLTCTECGFVLERTGEHTYEVGDCVNECDDCACSDCQLGFECTTCTFVKEPTWCSASRHDCTVCRDCVKKIMGIFHFYGDGCGRKCTNVCQVFNPDSHKYEDCEDGVCIRCGERVGPQEHVFIDGCLSTTCQNCLAQRGVRDHDFGRDCTVSKCLGCHFTRGAFAEEHQFVITCGGVCENRYEFDCFVTYSCEVCGCMICLENGKCKNPECEECTRCECLFSKCGIDCPECGAENPNKKCEYDKESPDCANECKNCKNKFACLIICCANASCSAGTLKCGDEEDCKTCYPSTELCSNPHCGVGDAGCGNKCFDGCTEAEGKKCYGVKCDTCNPGGKFKAMGHLRGLETLGVADALEVLKSLVGMDGTVKSGNDNITAAEAKRVGTLSNSGVANDKPMVACALEILKKLVGMESVVKGDNIAILPKE